MPEGPELHLASLFVNRMCAGLVFTGAVEKSEVNKNPEVPFCCDAYIIKAQSRGKEVILTLTPFKNDGDRKRKVGKHQSQHPMDVVFRFGMSGFFRFTSEDDLPKHAHLRFYTNESPRRVLSFEDTRRFGSWQANGTWQKDRGPCVMFEYESFRENVLSNLSDKAFDKPICEALLNQKYFNGIGNYLRAEILFRLQIPPFVKARTVLEGIELKIEDKKEIKKTTDTAGKKGVKVETPDLLSLCHTVPLEVVKLGENGYKPAKAEYSVLQAWMQCYSVDGMNSLTDHNGRTIWFKGDPGPMVPKGAKSRKNKWKIQKDHDYTDSKKAKKTHAESIAIEKPAKKKDNIKVKKESATSKAQSGTKRQNKDTKRVSTEPADENKKSKKQGKRSLKVPPRTGTNKIKGQHEEELIKTKRNSVTCRASATKAKPKRRSSGTRRGRSR
ncbi:endonuclease 8-like 1 isoform X2 [Rhinichthys klamathensis goyatoka]|uniref:endonuclease 8-like 1 isoform X2 n=1 Tax=Rhinichthys klamathensis goyatoka TaxID=3034132 RepID=UPI0024B48FCC|nr:endonuclease 8-like 1 isoform X2 [Rhinichthys klamathensis goyatoka]